MKRDECAVCSELAPEDYWSEGWICVTADGTVLSREDVSGVPTQVVVAPRGGSCLVCSESCLHVLVWRELHRPREAIADRL